MYRPPHPAMSTPLAGANTGSHEYPPRFVPNHAPQGEPSFDDGSMPIFSMYLETAAEEDNKMAEGWKADADGILLFTGLFSAAVATLISFSIQDIRPNSQDTSVFYLANIYQLMADPNRSNIPLPLIPPAFSPPTFALWVNALWFLSLVISLICALLATLLRQWARRYIKVTQPRYAPHRKARIRAFFSEGVDKLHFQLVVEALPTLLHLSLFFFFAGLVVYLCNVNLMMFNVVLSWVIAGVAGYGCLTLMPIFRHDSPFYTPLSFPAWLVVNGVPFIVFRFLRWYTFSPYSRSSTSQYFKRLEDRYYRLLSQGILKTAEETALNLPLDIDSRAFMRTFDSLDEDDELERFFANLPGFRSSMIVGDPLPDLPHVQQLKLFETMIGLLDRTFSSDLLPKNVKDRRAIVCAKAIDPIDIPKAFEWILQRILLKDQDRGLQTTEFGRLVSGWGDGRDQRVVLLVQAIVSVILARVQERDDRWFTLASKQLGVPESDLRGYVTRGDDLSLSILIHITRQVHSTFSGLTPQAGSQVTELSDVLGAVSEFTARDTSAEQQHDFCALWNQIALEAKSRNGLLAWFILRRIRNVYIGIHHGTRASPTDFSAATSDQDRILRHPSAYPLCRIHDRNPNLPVTPHTHDASFPTIVHSVDHSFIDTPTSVPPLASASTLHGAISRRHNADPSPSSDVSDIQSPSFLLPVFGNTFPLGPRLSSDPPTPRSNNTSLPESHSSMPPPVPLVTYSLFPGSAPDQDLSVKKLNPANGSAAPDYPPQSLAPPSTSDTAIGGPSRRSLVAEQSGNHCSHPPHGSFDAPPNKMDV
ncbi:hypothetical protein EDB87DRAFT_1121937 [Lactarius vividus]|nr:hypothetical protein EDB87DRAFT_1121937 [Lactarius vividus]